MRNERKICIFCHQAYRGDDNLVRDDVCSGCQNRMGLLNPSWETEEIRKIRIRAPQKKF